MQATSDKTASANFTQTGNSIKLRDDYDFSNGTDGYQAYYQWGRKDAFRSAEYTDDPADGTTLVFKNESVSVGTTIQNPTTFYSKDSNTYTPLYYNAWSATVMTGSETNINNDFHNKTVKTVYDPCPVGYTVPPANTFYGFSKRNCTVDGNGRKYISNGKTLYFPFSGQRARDSAKLTSIDYNGFYLISSTTTNDHNRGLSMNSSGLNYAFISEGESRAQGFSVRPVSENVRQH